MDEKPTTENPAPDAPRSREDRLSLLRQRLGDKAKREPKFKFYTLYGHLSNWAVLCEAWRRVRSNGGGAGIDGTTLETIEESSGGPEAMLTELQRELRDRTYRPRPVRRVYIAKPDGRLRPLGIPTVRDRVAQMAASLILEPIFEADFLDCSYAFRPKRSAHDALREIQGHLAAGHCAVYDADLKGYFDSIPHERLLACLRLRISDRTMLGLIRMWLETPVVEPPRPGGGGGGCAKANRQGTPQGGVISPLLANLYLHWFDVAFHRPGGPAQWAKAKLVRYADDFVVLARYLDGRVERWIEAKLEGWMGLRLNRDKTRVLDLGRAGQGLDFLSYTFRFDRDLYGGSRRYLNLFASDKSLARERERLRGMTGPDKGWRSPVALILDLNEHLRGWANYFKLGYPRKAFGKIDAFAMNRVIGFLRRKSQRPYRKPEGTSFYEHVRKLGLAPIAPPAKASISGKAGCGKSARPV